MQPPTSPGSSLPDRADPILCFIDLETTGLDPLRHGVRQISGCIVDERREEDEWFDFKVQPFPHDELDLGAMEKLGVDVEEFAFFLPPDQAYKALFNIFSSHVDRFNRLDKMVLLGYNVRFDEAFFREFWRKADAREGKYFGSWFFMPPIDVAQLAHLCFLRDRLSKEGPEYFSLEHVARYAGLGVDSTFLHDAFYDVELTRELYFLVTRRLRGE